MKLPKGLSESEVLETINRVLDKLVKQFTFGYYDVDDIRQEGLLIGIAALEKYDDHYSLKNFLHMHIRRRLINFVRDNYYRKSPPCKLCHNAFTGNERLTQHTDGKFCKKYNLWQKRNTFKINDMRPIDIDNFNDENQSDCFHVKDKGRNNMMAKEIYNLIEMKIPISLRKHFLQLTNGINIPPYKKQQIIDKIKNILTDDEMERLIEAFDEEETD